MVKLVEPGLLSNMLGMPGMGQPSGGLTYLLRDEFTDTLTAGNVHGTASVPGPGTRTVVDTGSVLALTGGVVDGGARTSGGDPALWLDAVTRAAGVLAVWDFTPDNTTVYRHIGWDTNLTGVINEALLLGNTGNLIPRVGASGIGLVVGTYTATSYEIAIVLRATGLFYFIKGGSFSSWTLLWIDSAQSNATIYPSFDAGNMESSYLRIPDALWLPTPLVSDGFTDDNSTSLDAHATGGDGHAEASGIGSGGDGLTWTEESGDWDIQSNRANPDGAAIASVDASDADVLVDCTVNGGAGDQPAIVLRLLDTSNYWYLQADRANDQLELHEYNATVDNVRANAAVTFNDSTDYDLRAIAYGQTIDGYADGGNKITYGSAALNETKTEHGIRAENTAGQFDDFVVYARDGFSDLGAY